MNLLKSKKFLYPQGQPTFATTVMVRGTLPESALLKNRNTFATTAEVKDTLIVFSEQFCLLSKSMFELMGCRPFKDGQWFQAVLLAMPP